jgi:hypothetical protein
VTRSRELNSTLGVPIFGPAVKIGLAEGADQRDVQHNPLKLMVQHPERGSGLE